MSLQTNFKDLNELGEYAYVNNLFDPLIAMLRSGAIKEQINEVIEQNNSKATSNVSFESDEEAERFFNWIKDLKLERQLLFPDAKILT